MSGQDEQHLEQHADDAVGGPVGPEHAWTTDEPTRALRRLQSAMDDAEGALAARLAIGATDLAAMTHLTFAPDPIGPRELSGRLGITPGATTELVDRLERAGHLERRRDTVDRRRVQLHASASTLGRVAGELRPLLDALDAVAAALDAHERDVVLRYLAGVLEAYETFARQEADG